jgi:hypothetical protein
MTIFLLTRNGILSDTPRDVSMAEGRVSARADAGVVSAGRARAISIDLKNRVVVGLNFI